jgi:6-phosphogluconolactonase
VTIWDLYVGTLTKEFASEIRALHAGSNDPWRGNAGKVPLREAGFPQGGHFATGIDRFVFDDEDGSLAFADTVGSDLENPQYVALHPTRPVLYAAEWRRPSRLDSFVIRADGTFEAHGRVDTFGEMAVAAAVHPSGGVAYVAHWGDGTLTAVELDDAGLAVAAEAVVAGDPAGLATRAHHHQVVVTPDGRAVLVTDVGGDELLVFAAAADGRLDPAPVARVAFPEGSGPRHVEFHPSGRYVYVLGEWDSRLHILAADDGIPTEIVASVTTTPPGYEGANKTSEIHMHPSGATMYVGNRNSDCVTVFAVDDRGGVEPVEHHSTLGNGPASVRVVPSGRHLIVGNVYSGSLVVFAIDGEGRLGLVGEPVEARAPRSLVLHPRGA